MCFYLFVRTSRTGALRPTSGPGYGKRARNINGAERHNSKLPRGMYINHDDIVALAQPGNGNRNDDLLANMDREMCSLLSQVSLYCVPLDSMSFVRFARDDNRTPRMWQNERENVNVCVRSKLVFPFIALHPVRKHE